MFVSIEWAPKFIKIKLAKSNKKELNWSFSIKNVSHSIYHRSIQTKRRISKANIRYTVLTAFFFSTNSIEFPWQIHSLMCVCVFWLKYNNLLKFHQIFVLLNEFECVRCCNQWKIPIHEFQSVCAVCIAHTGLLTLDWTSTAFTANQVGCMMALSVWVRMPCRLNTRCEQ